MIAAGHRGQTSTTAANSTTSAPRRRGTANRATTHREDQEWLWSYQSGEPLGHFTCASRGNLAKLNYLDIKQSLDRCISQNKKGTLTSREIKLLVQEICDCHQEDKLQQCMVEMEMSAMQQKIQRFNVEQLGEMPIAREDGTMRILMFQMEGCASAEVR
jgi:hypothetical protein